MGISGYEHFREGQSVREFDEAVAKHCVLGSSEEDYYHVGIRAYHGYCGEHIGRM
jgi:hypothetical protein